MKALMLDGVRYASLHDVPVADVGPRDVRIRVKSCGMCGTDHSVYAGSLILPGDFPFFTGHELSGVVEEVGSEITDVSVGDTVTTNPVRYCGDCYRCRTGQQHYCERLAELWKPNGGMSEFVVADRQQVFVVPEDVGFDAAAFAEPVSVCLHCIDMAGITPGMSVAITGAGPIGLILLQLAVRAGAAFVLVSEPDKRKRGIAEKLGADVTIDPTTDDLVARAFEATNNRAFDVVIEASGNPEAAVQAMAITGMKSTLFWFSVYPMDLVIPVSPFIMYTKELTIKGVFFSPYTFPRTINLLPKLELESLISHHVPLDESPGIFDLYESGKAIKIMVHP